MENGIGPHDAVAYTPIAIYLGKMFFDKFFRKAEAAETKLEAEQSNKLDRLLAEVTELRTDLRVIKVEFQAIDPLVRKLERSVEELGRDVAVLKSKAVRKR